MIQDPSENTPSGLSAQQGDLDDENGIAAQAAQQGAGDRDFGAPLPDDGSGMPLAANETLSAEDDDDLEEEDDDALGDADEDTALEDEDEDEDDIDE